MDRVIKITSQQGFSEQWTVGNEPQNLNLCDFVIPSGMAIDLSRSYISFNSEITNDSGFPVNAAWHLDTDNNERFNCPTAALIRNAHVRNDRGQVESVRRIDTLACGLWSMTNTAESQKSDMNSFSVLEDGRGINNHTSYLLDCVTNNMSNNGGVLQTMTSTNLQRDLKVPLKDILGIGGAEQYSTTIFGETRLHLETNFKKLKSSILGGDEDASLMFNLTNNYGDIVGATVAGGGSYSVILETSGSYGDWQKICPFFVGQRVQCRAAVSAGAGDIDVDRTIIAMQFQTDNTANPPTGLAKVFITIDSSIFNNGLAPGAGNDRTLSAVNIRARTTAALTNTINRAELVLHTIDDDGNMPDTLTYPTYTTEEDNGNLLTSFNKQYICEAEADAVLIACCNNGSILPNRSIESYRYAINQEEQTGNRDIPVCNSIQIASPLQFDRLQRCLEQQIGVGWRNGQMRFYKQIVAQSLAHDSPITMICETLEELPESKMLNISIECAAQLQQLIIYKHITKTI